MPRRDLSPRLQALIDKLWLENGRGAIRVTIDGQAPPPGYELVESYAVVPNLQRPKFLLPVQPRSVGIRSAVAYNALRSPRRRATRCMTGMALGLAVDRFLGTGRMHVWIRRGCPEVESRGVLLRRYLSAAVHREHAKMAIGVHAPDPNHKPTVQLFDRSGPVGFAKIGWTSPTAALVHNEARTLRDLDGHRQDVTSTISVPRLLYEGTWNDFAVTVTEPLPDSVRRYSEGEPPATTTVQELSGPLHRSGLVETTYWANRWNTISTVAIPESVRTTLASHALWMEQACPEPMRFGRWHGDWVPWNLARTKDRLYVIDWEHSDPEVPYGFDRAHWVFQHEFVRLGKSVREASRAVNRDRRSWDLSDLASGQVVDLYLFEMALRTARLYAGGGSWNPRLYPGVFEVLNERRSALEGSR